MVYSLTCFGTIPFFVCMLVYNHFKKAKKDESPPFVFGFLSVLVMGFGGAMINHFLVARPQILFDDLILGAFFISWVLYLYFPFGIVRFFVSNPLFRIIWNVFQGFFTASAITGASSLARNVYPDSVFAPVIIGVIGGCGGGCVFPYFVSIFYSGERVTDSDLINPSLYVQVVFILAVYYNYVVSHSLKSFILPLGAHSHLTLSAEMVMGICLVFFMQYSNIMDIITSLFSSSSRLSSKTSFTTTSMKTTPTKTKTTKTSQASPDISNRKKNESISVGDNATVMTTSSTPNGTYKVIPGTPQSTSGTSSSSMGISTPDNGELRKRSKKSK